jgi:membrane-bound metal-dependent hydrolase YbcI (DUF457 family)
MYTYTHFLVGASGARAVASREESWKPSLLIGLAASLPDFGMVVQSMLFLISGEGRPRVWWALVSNYTWVMHSVVTIAAVAFLAEVFWLMAPRYLSENRRYARWFFLGWLSHPIIDAMTHGATSVDPNYDYFWPFRFQITPWVGFWDYRIPGSLMPGWIEIVVDGGLMAFLVYQAFTRIRSRRKKAVNAVKAVSV